jgi:hypothetical protein
MQLQFVYLGDDMIEVTEAGGPEFLEVRMTAPITESDYTDVLTPAIDRAIEQAENIRLLVILDGGPGDFTAGAMWQDSRLGFKHWRGFDRCAIATDDSTMTRLISVFGVLMPCPVALFGLSEADDARRWLRESLGSIQIDAVDDNTVCVRLMGKLDSEIYEGKSEDLDNLLAGKSQFGLVIDLREFDGWQGLGALRDHFALASAHVGQLTRAAIVGDAGWQTMASKVGKHAFGVNARHFGANEFDQAVAWVQTGA